MSGTHKSIQLTSATKRAPSKLWLVADAADLYRWAKTRMTIEGKCSGRRLRVSTDGEVVTVETLSGQQAGSIFTHTFAELKSRPDIVIDRDTLLHSIGILAGFFGAIIGLLCATRWGQGISVISFWVCVSIVVASIPVARFAPKKKVYLWSTKGGLQAFGLEENAKNQEDLRHFISELEALVRSGK